MTTLLTRFDSAGRILPVIALVASGALTTITSGQESRPDVGAARSHEPRSKQDEAKEALRGVWQRVGGATGESAAIEERWTFDADFVTTEAKLDASNVKESRLRYSLNPLRAPAEITLYGEDTLIQGIYRIAGDTLEVAINGIAETERPTGFTRDDSRASLSPLLVISFRRPKAAADWEARAVKALLSSDRATLPRLADEFRGLPPERRRSLPVTIRDDSVEFAFHGDLTLDSNIGFVEYLFAGKDRSYEALIVGSASELGRLAGLRPVFQEYRRTGGRAWWQARLTWVEAGEARSADLVDVFGKLSEEQRASFIDGLEIDTQGLGGEATTGMNVEGDAAFLPGKSGPVVLRIVIKDLPDRRQAGGRGHP